MATDTNDMLAPGQARPTITVQQDRAATTLQDLVDQRQALRVEKSEAFTNAERDRRVLAEQELSAGDADRKRFDEQHAAIDSRLQATIEKQMEIPAHLQDDWRKLEALEADRMQARTIADRARDFAALARMTPAEQLEHGQVTSVAPTEAEVAVREADAKIVEADTQLRVWAAEKGIRLQDLDRDGIPDSVDREVLPADLAALEVGNDLPWTVQKRGDNGLYQDVLSTADAQKAHDLFKQGPDYRVIDNELHDVAADYAPHYVGHDPKPDQKPIGWEAEYYERSRFAQELKDELAATDAHMEAAYDGAAEREHAAYLQQLRDRDDQVVSDEDRVTPDVVAEWEEEHKAELLELRAVLNRRSELTQAVLAKSDALDAAVDRVRDVTVSEEELAKGYAAAARDYAQATQALREFEAEPSKDAAVVAEYRELQAIEKRMADEADKAMQARTDGREKAHEQAVEASNVASRERDEFLEKRGIAPATPIPEINRNGIERGLSPEEIDKLVKAQRRDAAEKELDREAKAVAAAVPQIGEAHNQVRDQSAFADAQAKDRLVPEDVASAYKREGQKYLDANDPKKVAFVDKGNRLQTIRTFDDKAVEAMIQTADARGWSEVRVTGDEAFRRKAWIEATARGIEVKGYEPTEKDIQRAEQLAKATGHANAIEKNETLEAYRHTRDGDSKQKREAAREHPELVKAFAFEAAARSFARQRLNPSDSDAFMQRTREGIERDLAQGKPIPEIRRRQEAERRQDRGLDR